MISLELLAKHMAWANQEIYKEVKKLDPEVLDYFVVDKEWTVRTIMVHIVAALDKNNERSINLDEYSIFGYLRDNN